jgi:hypothetical protein
MNKILEAAKATVDRLEKEMDEAKASFEKSIASKKVELRKAKRIVTSFKEETAEK